MNLKSALRKLDLDTLSLIFTAGQQDQFGGASALAVYGRTKAGRSICITRNINPSVESVSRVVFRAEDDGMTNIHVSYDSCG